MVRAAQAFKPAAVPEPPSGWDGVLPATDPTHGANIARAEYGGLLAGIDLSRFSIYGKATRGEVAQIGDRNQVVSLRSGEGDEWNLSMR